MCVGCPVTLKTQTNITLTEHKLWRTYINDIFLPFNYNAKKSSRQKVFRMISSAPDLKHILRTLNIMGQRKIIQPVPVVLGCFGHFVPLYSRAECHDIH